MLTFQVTSGLVSDGENVIREHLPLSKRGESKERLFIFDKTANEIIQTRGYLSNFLPEVQVDTRIVVATC